MQSFDTKKVMFTAAAKEALADNNMLVDIVNGAFVAQPIEGIYANHAEVFYLKNRYRNRAAFASIGSSKHTAEMELVELSKTYPEGTVFAYYDDNVVAAFRNGEILTEIPEVPGIIDVEDVIEDFDEEDNNSVSDAFHPMTVKYSTDLENELNSYVSETLLATVTHLDDKAIVPHLDSHWMDYEKAFEYAEEASRQNPGVEYSVDQNNRLMATFFNGEMDKRCEFGDWSIEGTVLDQACARLWSEVLGLPEEVLEAH